LNSDITAEEMMKAVKHLKNKKASGLDCISNEMIKASFFKSMKQAKIYLFFLKYLSISVFSVKI
jgi:hypothetical protein